MPAVFAKHKSQRPHKSQRLRVSDQFRADRRPVRPCLPACAAARPVTSRGVARGRVLQCLASDYRAIQ